MYRYIRCEVQKLGDSVIKHSAYIVETSRYVYTRRGKHIPDYEKSVNDDNIGVIPYTPPF